MQQAARSEIPAANGVDTPAVSQRAFWALTFGSIGVVYGDIGTSPLYALREAVLAAGGEEGVVTQAAVYGVLSLIFWSLIVVVTLKYVLILLRADHNGEGGTPALSVLSAVEGLNVATAAFGPYVLPLTVVILVVLFSVQSRGTARVSAFFAPITTIWFIAIAIAGAVEIAANPTVLAALNPVYGVEFLLTHGIIGMITLRDVC